MINTEGNFLFVISDSPFQIVVHTTLNFPPSKNTFANRGGELTVSPEKYEKKKAN